MSEIVVLTGGSTPERTVALSGAGQVVDALREEGFGVRAVDTCSGPIDEGAETNLLGRDVGEAPPSESELAALAREEDLLSLMRHDVMRRADCVFLVLHGRQGEGGEVQALLDLVGLPYTGSDALGSGLAMEKDTSKRLLASAGIPTPEWRRWPVEEPERALGLPFVVKPSRVGSTVGLSLVAHADQLDEAVGHALRFDDEVLLEKFVPGRELTVGVLGGEALGVGEIVSPGEVFDFEAKYTPGVAREVFPAEIDPTLAERARDLALQVHEVLRLRDYSRVDFRLDAAGELQCLEANTLPGMTQTSLLPQSAAVAGINFRSLCRRIVELAMARA